MKSITKGSCVLIILTIMSILLLLGLATYKSATFFEQFALARTKHEQKRALVQSLLEYGIQIVAVNYKKIHEFKDPFVLQVDMPDCQGRVEISKITQGLLLTATIKRGTQGSDTLSCSISKEIDEKIRVWGFQKV